MNRFENARNLLAVLLIVLTLGCGEDDNNGTNEQQFAPLTIAAVTDVNAIYTVNLAAQGTTTLRFPTSGQYQIVVNGQTVNGTVSNLQRHGNTWTATLTPDPNQQGAQSGALTLTWTGNNTGTFSFLPQSAPIQSGTFTVTQPTSSNGSGSNNNSGSTNNLSGAGTSTAALTGKTLQLNYENGAEKFVFTSGNAASYEDGRDNATYQYQPSTGQVNITRSGGQTYRFVLTPGSSSGTTSVTYVEPNSSPSVQSATYRLQ